MPDRKTVTFEESEATNAYLERVRAAKSRTVPVGGAEQLEGLPNFAQAVEEAKTGRGLPEQQTTYRPEQYAELLRAGKIAPGIGGAYPAVQEASGIKAPTSGRLSPATMAGLEALAEANTPEEQKMEQAEAENSAAESAKVEKPTEPDIEMLRVLMGTQSDYLQRKARRDAIEKRCGEVSLRQLLVDNGFEQRVPIVPDVLEVTYRSLNGHEDRFAKYRAWELCHGQDVSQAVYDTLLSLINMILSVTAINDRQVPDHRNASGDVDIKVFDKKFADMMGRPFTILSDLYNNFIWFDDRIRKTLDVESLGNG